MKPESISNLISKRVIKKMGNVYRLKRPIKIIVTKEVIEKLKTIYIENYEKGGILEGLAFDSLILITDFIEIPNTSIKNYNYAPNMIFFNSAVQSVLNRGNIPFAIHTHPIRLGIESYDKKRAEFFLKSSRPDKQIARDGITESLQMPEAIFTKDARLDNGFGLVFYTGWIFPASNVALSSLQIFTGSMAVLFRKINAIKYPALALLGLDFFRRPKYRLLKNGNYEISLSI